MTTLVVGLLAVVIPVSFSAQTPPLKATPDTRFSLMTFEAGGATRLGLVMGPRVLDIAGANRHVSERATLPAVAMPGEMKTLIEQYETVKPRLYQIANFFGAQSTAGLPFAYDVAAVKVLAPIKYPWNLMAASANYKAHAQGMGAAGAGGATPAPAAPATAPAPSRPAAGFDASAADRVVPIATRRSCSPSRRARASSTRTSRSTSSMDAVAPTTKPSSPS